MKNSFRQYFSTIAVASSLISAGNAKAQSIYDSKITKTSPVLVIVHVKAPWYAFDFLLRSKYRDVIPEYKEANQLKAKYFHIHKNQTGKTYGGIYEWETFEGADRWFSKEWFDRVRKERKTEPKVNFFPLLETKETKEAKEINWDKVQGSVALVVYHATSELKSKVNLFPSGLLRIQIFSSDGNEGMVLLFAQENSLNLFLKLEKPDRYEIYNTPILVKN